MVEDSGFAGNSSASITEPQPTVHFWSDANLTFGVPEILGKMFSTTLELKKVRFLASYRSLRDQSSLGGSFCIDMKQYLGTLMY